MDTSSFLKKCCFLPAKTNGQKFPALAGISTNELGDFAVYSDDQAAEFSLNRHLAKALCGSYEYHKLIPDHDDKIANADEKGSWWHGDGFWSFDPDFPKNKKVGDALISITADCPSVVISSINQSFISVIHSGWRGTEKRIIPKAINLAIGQGIDSSQLLVGLFPGICGQCYEVGPEFEKIFPGYVENDCLDLRSVIMDQITGCGINAEQIFTLDYCSLESQKEGQFLFQSVRRNKSKERNAVFIARQLI